MNIKQKINKLVLTHKDKFNDIRLTSYILCKTFGWDYYTLKKQPIPFIFDMLDMIILEAKIQKEGNPDEKDGKKSIGFGGKKNGNS